ncbi:hypothetical protein HanPSC8_Chr16g0712621 [Helianthus annuus]|nr:hypothetical protein HanPSC8_Chr16g0712621 [Helianthus annuus]
MFSRSSPAVQSIPASCPWKQTSSLERLGIVLRAPCSTRASNSFRLCLCLYSFIFFNFSCNSICTLLLSFNYCIVTS